MQYRQDVRHIAHYYKRKPSPSYTRFSENRNNTSAENPKIRGLKFDTLYWRHLWGKKPKTKNHPASKNNNGRAAFGISCR